MAKKSAVHVKHAKSASARAIGEAKCKTHKAQNLGNPETLALLRVVRWPQ